MLGAGFHEPAYHQHCARDRHDRPGERTRQRAPSQELSGQVAQREHQAHLHDGDQRHARAQAHQLAQAELESQREHQKNDAQFGQRMDRGDVHHGRDRDVRTHQQPGEQVAQHHGQVQALEQHRRDGGDAEHHGEVLQKEMGVGHAVRIVYGIQEVSA